MQDEFFCGFEMYFDDLGDCSSTRAVLSEFESEEYEMTESLFAEMVTKGHIPPTRFNVYETPNYMPEAYDSSEGYFFKNFALRTDYNEEY